MKTLFSLAACFLTLACHAQRIDTVRWYRTQTIKMIRRYDNGVASVEIRFPGGQPMASGRFRYDNGYIPVSDVTLLDTEGHKVQQFLFDSGTLIDYLPDGKVKSVFSAPLQDSVQSLLEYYENGTVKTRTYTRKKVGASGVGFSRIEFEDDVYARFRPRRDHPPYLSETFYPDGHPYTHAMLLSETPNIFRKTWYLPDGRVDTSSYLKTVSNGPQLEEGTRLDWYENGRLRSEEQYKNGKMHGPKRYWFPNGQLLSEFFFHNGFGDSVERIWHANGQLSWYRDYGNPIASIGFYPNGQVSVQGALIRSEYDSTGRLVRESIYTGEDEYNEMGLEQIARNRYAGRFRGMRVGPWRAYGPRGQLLYSTHYRNGFIDGETRINDSLGRQLLIVNYQQLQLHGPYTLFQANGRDTVETGAYYKGRKRGTWRYFYPNGRLQRVIKYGDSHFEELYKYEEQGRALLTTRYDAATKQTTKRYYANGRLDHEERKQENRYGTDDYQYYPNGRLKRSLVYAPDSSRTERRWFDNGRPELAVRRKCDTAFGTMTTWYRNGHKRAEGAMQANLREGRWILYKEDGSIEATPDFVQGVELIKTPQTPACFCNTTYPAFSNLSFDSTESHLPLKAMNALMQRFQLDDGYKEARVRCFDCDPMPILAYRDIRLFIDTGGMYLNLTPCRHGANYGVIKVKDQDYDHFGGFHYGEDDDGKRIVPLTFPEALARTVHIAHNQHMPLAYLHLNEVFQDTAFFQRFLRSNYDVNATASLFSDEQQQWMLLEWAENNYNNDYFSYRHNFHPRDSTFAQSMGYLLAREILSRLPAQADLLRRQPTDRKTIEDLLELLAPSKGWEYVKPLVYGRLRLELDTGALALTLPLRMAQLADTLAGQRFLEKGHLARAAFPISYASAEYDSYPTDHLRIVQRDDSADCTPPFFIGSTEAWLLPTQLRLYLGGRESQNDTGFSPYYYPAHYTHIEKDPLYLFAPYKADLDDYIRHFMGALILHGQLHLPGLKTAVPVQEVIVDGSELNGLVWLSATSGFTEDQVAKALAGAGFTVYPASRGPIDPDEGFVLYFHYKP